MTLSASRARMSARGASLALLAVASCMQVDATEVGTDALGCDGCSAPEATPAGSLCAGCSRAPRGGETPAPTVPAEN
jgi:hypothetical protein